MRPPQTFQVKTKISTVQPVLQGYHSVSYNYAEKEIFLRIHDMIIEYGQFIFSAKILLYTVRILKFKRSVQHVKKRHSP